MKTQLTVPIEKNLREFLARRAEQEDRSLAGVARRILAEAARAEKRSTPAAAA